MNMPKRASRNQPRRSSRFFWESRHHWTFGSSLVGTLNDPRYGPLSPPTADAVVLAVMDGAAVASGVSAGAGAGATIAGVSVGAGVAAAGVGFDVSGIARN